MGKKTIFIGSAKETIEVAKKIAQALGDQAYNPVRWWTAFQPGTVTIDELTKYARSVDGAVFLFTGIDKTWYRGAEVMSPVTMSAWSMACSLDISAASACS